MNATRLLNLFENWKSFACRAGFQGVIVAIGIAAMCASAHAVPMIFDAVQDTTIYDRPSGGGQRDQNFNGTGLQIWNNNSGNATNGRRRGAIFQFDLSSLSASDIIAGAYLEYYDTGAGDYNGNNNSAFTNLTFIVTYDPSATNAQLQAFNAANEVAFDSSGMHEQYVTYNSAGSAQLDKPGTFWSGQWAPSISSMNLSLPAGNLPGYHAAGNADATALTRLNTAKNDNGFALFISFWDYNSPSADPGVITGRSFGDKESGFPVKLVLNVVPEPSSIVMLSAAAVGLLGMAWAGRRKSRS